MTQDRIAIVGGGIAGLVAAIALLQRGIDVTVYEQAAELREVGAGLQLSPNGTRVLIELGLEERLAPFIVEAAGKEVRHWQTGQAWKLFDLGQDCRERFGAPYWMAHRADFHTALIAAATALKPDLIRLGVRIAGFAQDAASVTIQLADGNVERAAALVGADGVHSVIRRSLGHEDRPNFTGIMAWRGFARMADLPEEIRRQVGTNWVGPGGHIVTYPLKGGAALNFVGIVEGRDWPVESWTEAGTHAECAADFAGWHPLVSEIIHALDQPFKWALLGREPLSRWAEGRVCLIGDSAHPTLPFLGQGANMAIEDALVLARAIAATPGDPATAFARVEALRADRTARIVRQSRAMATTFHNPLLADPREAEAFIAREWRPDLVRTRYDWLFEYDARTVALEPALAA